MPNRPICVNSQGHELKVMHFNVQSLRGKKHELTHFLATNKVHICALNETWLAPSHKFAVKNYQTIRKDRSSPGGGVCVLVHEDICFQTIKAPNAAPHDEAIFMAT